MLQDHLGLIVCATVSALAGHTQITTTAAYLKVFDEDKEDAVRRLRYESR